MPRVIALSGLGGTGKTSMAVEYAYRHLAEVGVAWQFPAEDAAVIAAGFGALAAQLGVLSLADTRDPVASVHAVLATFPSPWLLIFDNAADMSVVATFLPPAGPGRVLITSQNPSWPGQSLDVPVLGRDVAAGFLVSRTDDSDLQAAQDLADVLGGLPLALEQAGAYTQAAGNTLAGYLDLYRHRRPELLARGEPTGYSGTVASTWALAFDRLQQTAPSAVGLLRLLAFYAPEAIPVRMLLLPRPGLAGQFSDEVASVLMPLLEDPLEASDAITALRRFSLVTLAADGSVSAHRLVQAVTADQMAAELAQDWRQAAAALIEAAIPPDPQQPANWQAFRVLMPHAQAVLADGSIGMTRFADYLGSSGSHAAARDLTGRILAALERAFGPEHPSTLNARHHFAYWTGEAGDRAAARDLFTELVPLLGRVHGSEHPYVLTARHELARWTGLAGDPAAARDMFADLTPVGGRVSGSADRGTLTTLGNLADWTGDAGDPAAARDMFAELMPVRERVLGPEDPSTLNARHEFARWTGEAGDPAAARDMFADLVSVLERVLGLEHPHTLTTRQSLARWTGEAGDPAAARDMFAELVPMRERVSGAEHPDTLAARANLADWTGEAGDPAAARDMFAELVPMRGHVLGPEHRDTLNARAGLAYWTGQAGDPEGAQAILADLMPILKQAHRP